jgi:hypothetical protein
MLSRIGRLFAIVVVAQQLGACINSDYDLSLTLKPEFPVKLGTYAKTEGGTLVVIRKAGDAYQIYNRTNKLTTYVRLYKIPEFPDYVMQYYDRKKNPIIYLFLKITEKGFEIYDIDKLGSVAPEHVVKLLKPISEQDHKDNNITVANGKRDTLYVVRELARASLKMSVAETYERRP